MTTTSLPNFQHIGPRTSLYVPTDAITGQLIILCTWLGAGRKHIAKYTALHQRIASGAHILLVESSFSNITSSYAIQHREIQSAVSAVADVLMDCEQSAAAPQKTIQHAHDAGSNCGALISETHTPITPKIVLQTFSNGGTNTATHLLLMLRERLQKPLPLAGLICDSGPAQGTYWRSYDAMLLSLPKDTFSRLFGAILVHGILIILGVWMAVGNENPATLNRRVLLDNHYLLGTQHTADEGSVSVIGAGRVCYIYSKADRMCWWTDVAEHAETARQKGWQVQEIIFDDSAHCAHLQRHETVYVDAVTDMWDGATPKVSEKPLLLEQ